MEEFNISGDFLHIQDVRHALMTEQKQSTTAEAQVSLQQENYAVKN